MKRSTRFRNILLGMLSFLLMLQPTLFSLSHQNLSAKSESLSFGNSVWMHIDTFFQQNNSQINNFALTLKLGKIDNVIILAKNIDGTITYPSNIGFKCYSNNTMENFVALIKSNGIKVYFYYPINTDPAWLKANAQDIAFQAGTKGSKVPIPDPAKKLINLTSKNYRNYIVKLMEEAIKKYSIDGVQLDYIRYTNGLFGFSKEELTEANKRKISMSKIIDYTYQTFISPGDWKTILDKYDEGDKDVLAWAKLREDIIYDFVLQVANSIKSKNVQIGSTLVSSGANAKAYTAIHFGQNWEKMSSILNFVTPMAYHGSREDVKKFIEEICLGAISKINSSCKIAIGIQANETSTEKMMEAIQTVKENNLSFILFRIGTFAFTSFDFFPVDKEQTILKLIISNHVESKQIKGIEIKNTGNILTFSNFPINFQLQTQNETKASIISTNPIKLGELIQLELMVKWNWEISKSCFTPIIVVSDGKTEIPTLNMKYFNIDQLVINQKTQTIQYKGQNLQKNIIKFENQKTWVSIAGLDQILGFKTINTSQQIEVIQNESRFIVNQDEKKGNLFFGKIAYSVNEESFFNHPGYLPLKELMDLFRIHVSYNQKENIVFCTALSRDASCSVYGKINSLSSLELWITDSSEILIDLDDFLTCSFYAEMHKIHLSGRSVRIITKNEKHPFYDTEKMIQLITDEKSSSIIPDQFSYFTNQNLDRKMIPQNRQIFTDKPSIFIELRKKGCSTIMVMNQSTFSSLQDPIEGYYDMSNQTIADRININQLALKNIRNLYFLTNLKF